MSGRSGRARTALVAPFFAGVALGAAALRETLPAGGSVTDRAEIKLAHLARSDTPYDTLFIGSSRTFRGFVPGVFDALTAAAGRPTHSFNLGLPGHRAPEALRLVERVARIRPDGWRTIFVDPEGFEVLLDERNHLSRAVIDWHDLATTRLVTGYMRENPGDGPRGNAMRAAAWRHVTSCAYNLAGVGRGLALADRALGIEPDPDEVAETLGPSLDGYSPRKRQQSRDFKQLHQEFEDRVEDLARQEDELEPGPPARQPEEVFTRIQERIEALGARPVFVAQSGLYLNADLLLAARAGSVRTLLRFDQRELAPELYELEARFDSNHLNATGAERFTRALAEAWLALGDER